MNSSGAVQNTTEPAVVLCLLVGKSELAQKQPHPTQSPIGGEGNSLCEVSAVDQAPPQVLYEQRFAETRSYPTKHA